MQLEPDDNLRARAAHSGEQVAFCPIVDAQTIELADRDIDKKVSSHVMAFASHMATYAGSIERNAHGVTRSLVLTIEIMESEHSRGELMACCHRRDIKGLVQKLKLSGGLDRPHPTESAATARRVAVEESEHDEKHTFNKLVAVAV